MTKQEAFEKISDILDEIRGKYQEASKVAQENKITFMFKMPYKVDPILPGDRERFEELDSMNYDDMTEEEQNEYGRLEETVYRMEEARYNFADDEDCGWWVPSTCY